jgi:subtilisin family serine protease
MNGDYAAELGLTGKNIKIAVIDLGLDRTADLTGANIMPGRNYIDFTSDTADTSSNKHGTTVAAMIAAETVTV